MFDMLSRLTNYLILLFLFLLPLQTRWIIEYGVLNDRPWEFGTLSLYGMEILLWLIVILTGGRLFGRLKFWRMIFTVEHFKTHKKNILAVLIFLFCLAFFIRSGNPLSWQFTTWFLGGLCLVFSVAVSELPFSRAVSALWLGGVVQGLLAVQQFFSQRIISSKWLGMAAQNAADSGVSVIQFGGERWLRAYGSFGWPNSLGVFLAVALVIGIIIFYGSNRKHWPYILAGQMTIFIGLIFTFSRGAWLAAVIGLAAYFAIILKQKNKFALLMFAKQILAFALIIIALLSVYFPLFSARASAGNYLEKLSLNERAAQYQIVKKIIFNHPFVGIGPGLYTRHLSEHYAPPSYGQYQPVHNIYLLSLAEMGVLVFLCFCAFVFLLIKRIWRIRPIYLSVLAVLFVAGLFDHFLWSLYAGQLVWWTVFALGLIPEVSIKSFPSVSLDNKS